MLFSANHVFILKKHANVLMSSYDYRVCTYAVDETNRKSLCQKRSYTETFDIEFLELIYCRN